MTGLCVKIFTIPVAMQINIKPVPTLKDIRVDHPQSLLVVQNADLTIRPPSKGITGSKL